MYELIKVDDIWSIAVMSPNNSGTKIVCKGWKVKLKIKKCGTNKMIIDKLEIINKGLPKKANIKTTKQNSVKSKTNK